MYDLFGREVSVDGYFRGKQLRIPGLELALWGSGAVTLPRRMWDDLRFAIDPTIAAVSTLTIVLTAVALGGAHLCRRGGATSR